MTNYELQKAQRELASVDTPLRCRLTIEETLFADASDSIVSHSSSLTVCIPIQDAIESDYHYYIDLPLEFAKNHSLALRSGQLLVDINDAVLEDDQVVLSSSSTLHLLSAVDTSRHLSTVVSPVMGNLTLMIVRVSTSDGAQPPASLDTLKERMFGSGPGLRSQYQACSFNQLNFVDSGGLDIVLDQPMSAFTKPSQLLDAASAKIQHLKSVSSVSKLADKVLFCQPPGTGNWLAVAPVGSWKLNFNAGWCTSLSATMHEMGHAIGLRHSGIEGASYGDKSGYMGYGSKDATTPAKCFNALKNYQLGWYQDKVAVVNPAQPVKATIGGFVDYDSSDDDVILKIDDYYVEYNLAQKFNAETSQAINQVTITKDANDYSRRVAILDVGDRYSVANYNNTGHALVVEVCEHQVVNGLDKMVVSIAYDESYCNQELPPTFDLVNAVRSSTATASSCHKVNLGCDLHSECCSGLRCLADSHGQRSCKACRRQTWKCRATSDCCGALSCVAGRCRVG